MDNSNKQSCKVWLHLAQDDLQISISADYGNGTISFGNGAPMPVYGTTRRLTAVSSGTCADKPAQSLSAPDSDSFEGENLAAKVCGSEFNWRVGVSAGVSSGTPVEELIFCNSFGQLIGRYPVAQILYDLDVRSPRVVHDRDTGQPIHTVCSFGFSYKLGLWLCWGFDGFMSALTESEAEEYSRMNSMVSMRDTMRLKKAMFLLCNAMEIENIKHVVNKVIEKHCGTDGPVSVPVTEIYGTTPSVKHDIQQMANEFGQISDNPCDSAVAEGVNQELCLESTVNEAKSNPSDVPESESTQTKTSHFANNTSFPYGVRSGEHQQHLVTRRPSANLNRGGPRTGEHRQHHVIVSQSAAVKEYTVVRYKPANGRAKHLRNHHAQYEMSLEANEVFGYRRGIRNVMYLIDLQEPKVEFKLTERELDLLLKSCVPYKGKVPAGIKVVSPAKELAIAVKTDAKRKVPESPKQQSLRAAVEGKGQKTVKEANKDIKSKAKEVKKLQIFGKTSNVQVGLVQTSAFVDEYSVLLANTAKELDFLVKAELKRKNSTAIPMYKTFVLKGSDSLVVNAQKQQYPVLAKAVGDSIANKNQAKSVMLTQSMEKFSVRPKQPATGYKLKQPIYTGNETSVLLEIAKAINEGFFSAEFKPHFVKDGKLVPAGAEHVVISNPPRIVLASANNSPLFMQEAKNTVDRIRRAYGNFFRGKVTERVSDGKEYAVIVLGLILPEREPKAIERSRLIHTMVQNMDKIGDVKASIDELNHLTQQIKDATVKAQGASPGSPDAVKLGSLIDRQSKLANELTEALSSDALIMNAPVYSIRKGKVWLTVEVVDYNIHDGTLTVRQVRGGNKDKEVVSDLWIYGGGRKII